MSQQEGRGGDVSALVGGVRKFSRRQRIRQMDEEDPAYQQRVQAKKEKRATMIAAQEQDEGEKTSADL